MYLYVYMYVCLYVCMQLKKVMIEDLMDLIPKWRPINYSFVGMFISPLSLIFT